MGATGSFKAEKWCDHNCGLERLSMREMLKAGFLSQIQGVSWTILVGGCGL